MKFRLKTYHFLLFFGIIFFQNAFAQQVSDSAYNAAILSIYDDPDKAIQTGIRMFENHKNQPKKQINGLLLVANAYSSKREYEKSLNYAFKARELSQQNNRVLSEVSVLNNIAAQYHQLGINDKALQYLDESDQIIAAYPHKDSVRMILGNNYAVRGFIYRDQLSCDIAIDYFNRSLNQYKTDADNPRILVNMSVISYNKGNCFITLAQTDSARIILQESLSYALKADAKSLEAFSRKGLAEVYTLLGNYNQAIAELNTAMAISQNVGDLVLNQGLYKGLADNYLATNNWELYQLNYNKYIQTEAQNKKAERKTISTSLSKHSQEIDTEIKSVKSTLGIAVFCSIILLFILISAIVYGQLKFRKHIKIMKSKLKSPEKEVSSSKL